MSCNKRDSSLQRATRSSSMQRMSFLPTVNGNALSQHEPSDASVVPDLGGLRRSNKPRYEECNEHSGVNPGAICTLNPHLEGCQRGCMGDFGSLCQLGRAQAWGVLLKPLPKPSPSTS